MSVNPTPADTLGSDCPVMLYKLGQFTCTKSPTRLALLGDRGIFRSPFFNEVQSIAPVLVEGGKIKKVRIQLLKRECTDNLDDCSTVDPCTAVETDQYDEFEVDFDPICTSKKLSVKISDFQRTCTTVDQGMLERIWSKIDALNKLHERKLMAQLIAGAGANVVGGLAAGEYQDIPATINEHGLINANALHAVKNTFVMNEMEDCTVLAIGGMRTALTKIDTIQRIGCCNDKGVNQQAAADMLGMGHFRSKEIETAFANAGAANPESALAFVQPGSVHLIDWYSYDGDGAYSSGLNVGTTFTDVRSGVKYDLQIVFNNCSPTYTLTLSKNTMLWTKPLDTYKECDELNETNGIILAELGQCTPAACPEPVVE